MTSDSESLRAKSCIFTSSDTIGSMKVQKDWREEGRRKGGGREEGGRREEGREGGENKGGKEDERERREIYYGIVHVH